MNRILLISAPPSIKLVVRDTLPRCAHLDAETISDAVLIIRTMHPDVVILCQDHLDPSLETAVRELKEKSGKNIPLIISTNPKPLDFVINLSQLEEVHYFPLPLDEKKLKQLVLRTVSQTAEEVGETHPILQSLSAQLIGKSRGIEKVKNLICKFADSKEQILIVGETGTGKEIVATMIHELSRKKSEFRCINCSAISDSLAESELFGYRQGSFTGADRNHEGYFLTCSGGSLFMDEIGDLSITLQPKLLRALEEKQIQRIGDTSTVSVDTRVITATNRNLKHLISEGRFREDLYHRISTLQIYIPPLKERKEDIPLLVNHFLQDYQNIKFSPSAMDELKKYDWPGNVRELRTAVVRARMHYCGDSSKIYHISRRQVSEILHQEN